LDVGSAGSGNNSFKNAFFQTRNTLMSQLTDYKCTKEGTIHLKNWLSKQVKNMHRKIWKNYFSCDPDKLSSFFLKKLSFSFLKPLIWSFECSLNVGKVPKQWKNAVVVPLHKKDLSITKSFRTYVFHFALFHVNLWKVLSTAQI